MTVRKTIVHKAIMVAALMLSAAALPFSIKLCHAGLIILVINWLLEGKWSIKLSIIQHSLLLQVLICLFALQLVELAFFDNLSRGWFEIEKKIFFLLVPVVLATTAIRLKRTEIKSVIISFLIACFIGTILCIAHAWHETNLVMAGKGQINPYLSSSSYYDLHALKSKTWLLFSYVSLSEGIDLHPTYFSLFLGFNIIFLLNEFRQVTSRLIQAGIMILILFFSVFIVFLSSRIVILGLSVIFIFVLFRCIVRKEKSSALLATGIASVFFLLLFINPVSRYRSLQEIDSSSFQIQPGNEYKNAANIRVSLWWLALKSLGDSHPLFGTGTGGVEKAMVHSSGKYQITNIINSFDPHNQYLYTLLENGFLGFLLLILYLGLPIFFAWSQKINLILGFSFIFCLLCFTESALALQKGIVFYSLFSGVLFYQLNSFQNISINVRSLLRAGN